MHESPVERLREVMEVVRRGAEVAHCALGKDDHARARIRRAANQLCDALEVGGLVHPGAELRHRDPHFALTTRSCASRRWLAAATRAAKSRPAQSCFPTSSSGWHWMPTANRFDDSSMPSTSPSDERATALKPSPRSRIAWR